MIWDGSNDSLLEIKRTHPSAVVYAMQTKLSDGSYIFDEMLGAPVLVIEDRDQPGRVFEIGQDVK